jgi:hypothetical protein
MQNAHQRLGRLEYLRSTEKTNTHLFLHVDHYVGNGNRPTFSRSSEVMRRWARSAPLSTKSTSSRSRFRMGGARRSASGRMPSATTARSRFRARSALCGIWSLCPRRCVRMVLPVRPSSCIFDAESKELAWATVVSLLGLPADPRWGELILGEARKEKRMRRLEGIGCNPAVVLGTREDFMLGIRHARSLGRLPFPENNGPIVWPQYTIRNALVLTRSSVQRRSAF